MGPAYDWDRRRWSASVDTDVLALRQQLGDASDSPVDALQDVPGLASKAFLLRWLEHGAVDTKAKLDQIWASADVEHEQDIPELYLYVFGDPNATVPQITASTTALARIYNLY